MSEACKGDFVKRQAIIIICGPYSGKGHAILSQFVRTLRALDFPAHLCSELCPARGSNAPQAIQEATYTCMKLAKGYLLVFLSALSLGPEASEQDLTGGTAFESGILYSDWKEKNDVHVAFLFDGHQHRKRLSKMLQGNWMGSNLEAVVQGPGDLAELNDLAVQLCAMLSELICK